MVTIADMYATRKDACLALGISHDTFQRLWSSVFTDLRTPDERKSRTDRLVAKDELAVAVKYGNGERARAAVLAFRKQQRRM